MNISIFCQSGLKGIQLNILFFKCVSRSTSFREPNKWMFSICEVYYVILCFHYKINCLSRSEWLVSCCASLCTGAMLFHIVIDIFVVIHNYSPWNVAPYEDAAERTALGGISLDGFLSEVWQCITHSPMRATSCMTYQNNDFSCIWMCYPNHWFMEFQWSSYSHDWVNGQYILITI